MFVGTLYGFCLSIAYIARVCHPYIKSQLNCDIMYHMQNNAVNNVPEKVPFTLPVSQCIVLHMVCAVMNLQRFRMQL